MSRSVSHWLRSTGVTLGALMTLAFGVSRLQPLLSSELHSIKDTDDVYPFPPPPVLRLATLGYVAATTDVLWGKLLVENGQHWGEHRPFGDLEHYLDAIVELDPTFRPFYEYVDSLLCYRPMNGHEPDAWEARAYLERGTRELPNDAEIWTKYGQFVAFMGPSYLASDADRQAWKRDGAFALNHAVELGADVTLGIAASTMLDSRLGEHDAVIRFLERAYAITDDEGKRQEIAGHLARRHATAANDQAREALQVIESRWRLHFPFVDRGTFLLVGPGPDPLRCVGVAATLEPACSRHWDPLLAVGGSR